MRAVLGSLVVAVLLVVGVHGAGAQVDLSDLPPSYAREIADARASADRATAALGEAQAELGALEQRIDEVRSRAEATERRLATLREQVRELAVSQYTRAGTETPSIVDEDLNRQVRMNALARIVSQDDTDAMDQYLLALEDAELDQAELARLADEQRTLLAELEARRDAVYAELADLQAREAERQAEIARREEAERQRQAEIARREQAERQRAEAARAASARPIATAPASSSGSSASSGPSTGSRSAAPSGSSNPGAASSAPSTPSGPIASGSWVCPVQGPHSFVDTWGAPRSGGRRHRGVDMMAARGTPVVAPVAGSVTHRGNAIGGLSFHLYGVDGNYYFGTHLSAYGNAGQVAAGTVIGYVGDTGNARGIPHLHFEIHPGGGGAVNPTPTVRAHCP